MDVHLILWVQYLIHNKSSYNTVPNLDQLVSSALLCFWLIWSLIDINTVFVLLFLTIPNVPFSASFPHQMAKWVEDMSSESCWNFCQVLELWIIWFVSSRKGKNVSCVIWVEIFLSRSMEGDETKNILNFIFWASEYHYLISG